MQSPARKQPQVIIVGAGFGGLEAAKKLACKDVHLTVIDRTNYHLFQPLLYQVATAALSPADIAAPVRAILSKCKNVEVILAEVESVDVEARKVKTNDRVFDYDYLILATGARHSYFGHDEWEKLAPGLKSLEDAVELRRRILLAFEYAEKIEDEPARKAAMTFVIIGGGPTGVEMAGAIGVLIPRAAPFAAVGLCLLMLGAIRTGVVYEEPLHIALPAVLIALLALVVYVRI